MKQIIYIAILFLGLSTANAQTGFQQVLQSIEANNTTLKALKEQADADKIGNKTGINMANPEVEVGRLWANPQSEGNEFTWSVKQAFDFPTAYKHKSGLANEKNKQVDLAYQQQYIEIIQQARILCVELVYLIKQNKQLTDRLSYAKELSEGYQKMFDRGDIDILERNKTKLNLLNAEKSLQMNEVDMNTARAELQRLNGGLPLVSSLNSYSVSAFPLNFDDWFASMRISNPELQQSEQEIVMSRKQEQLTRALNLPKLSAGYSNERVGGIISQGFSIGVSIPLWEGKNTVKHQKAQTVALQMQYDDSQLQLQNSLKNQYDKASRLSVLLKEYQAVLEVTNDHTLLKKAFDKGQISLINYLLELEVYYDTTDKYLQTERDYQLAVSELQKWNI